MPLRDAAPIPAKNVKGTEITSAQGHDTIRNVRALYSHFVKATA